MTQLEQLELICNQYFNLADKINTLIEEEEYEEILENVNYKDSLIKKFFIAKKTVKLTAEQKQTYDKIEQQIKENEENTLNYLIKIHEELGKELKITNNKVKISSAYDPTPVKRHGNLIDFSE